MKLLSPKSASEIRELSIYCTDPKEGYLRMMDSVKAAELYVCKVVARNLFNKLIDRKIGTGEVESLARRIVGNEDEKRLQREVVRIMKIRRKNIEKELRTLRHEWHRKTDTMKRQIKLQQVRRKYFKIEKTHRQFVWETKVQAARRKVNFLKTKREKKQIQIDQAKTVWYKVTDEQLKYEEPIKVDKNYEVYGAVELTEPEKKCLALDLSS